MIKPTSSEFRFSPSGSSSSLTLSRSLSSYKEKIMQVVQLIIKYFQKLKIMTEADRITATIKKYT